MRRYRRVLGAGALWAVCLAQATRPGAPAARLPVPSTVAQAQSLQLIHTLFKTEYARTTAPARDALARTLLSQGAATTDDPTGRYVLFTQAADLASQAGDGDTALAAVTALAASYEVNPVPLKTQALIATGNACTAENAEKVADAALLVAAEAAAIDDFAAVTQLTAVAEAAGNKSKRVSVVAGLQPRVAEYRALAAEYDRAKKSLERLKLSPADADAHLVVGTFYGLHKGDWTVGLPHLARGSDRELAALAAKELATPTDGSEQVAIGDAWWSLAAQESGLAHKAMVAHAQEWYRRAQASLRGLTLTRIDARLGQAQPPTAALAVPGQASAPVTGQPLAAPALLPAAAGLTGVPHDLGALLDVARDTVSGTWHPVPGGGVTVAAERYAVLQFPYVPPEEYDLTIAFTRTAGDGSLAFLLASHRKSFGFALDVKGEARFERVGNKISRDNPTAVPVVITNGRKYVVTVEVRNDHLRALLDGVPVTEWKTDYKDMARYALWKVADDSLCGIGANSAAVTFHAMQIVDVSGKGKPTR